jgi:hypothetical protein
MNAYRTIIFIRKTFTLFYIYVEFHVIYYIYVAYYILRMKQFRG